MKPYQVVPAGVLLLLSIAFPFSASAQRTGKEDAGRKAEIRELVTSGRYVFKAQTALPMHGRTRYLTSDYDLSVSPDTLEAYLPYFGRAYSAPIDPTEGGIRFTSTEFDYRMEDRKKGGWDVTMKPRDAEDIQRLSLSISESGYASLHIISNRRQAISFRGRIEKNR